MTSRMLSVLFFSSIALQSCVTVNEKESEPKTKTPTAQHMIQSVLWTQNAAEFKALSHQAFNLAKWRLDEIVANNDSEKPLAIVTDVDETVLDNSPYNAELILRDENYNRETWIEWGEKRSATPIPGALDFFNYAHQNGVEIFYITNRYDTLKQATIDNMAELGFPLADSAHVYTKSTTSAKGPRRSRVEETHDIVLLLGDNLSDFTSEFDKQNTAQRNRIADSLKNEFGKKFIVLPNAMYGDWETAGVFELNFEYTESQKDSVRRSRLSGY